MNILKGTKGYLCGALQYGNFDYAIQWRQKVKEEISPLGIKVLSPLDNAFSNFPQESEMSFKKLKEYQEKNEFDYVHEQAKLLRNKDLAMIDNCNFIFAVLDIKVPTFGTVDEIILSSRARKAIYLITEGGYKKIPIWIASYVKPDCVYSTIDEGIQAIKDLDSGKIPLNRKYWRILNEEFR